MTVEDRTATADAPSAAPSAPRRATGGPPAWLLGSLPGAWTALAFACLSFTPSLLPRSGLFQGAVTGITAAIGYGLGVLGAWLWRELADRGPAPWSARAWRVLGWTAVAALAVSYLLGRRWQGRLRELMGAPGEGVLSQLLLPVVAVALLALLLTAGRLSRLLARALTRLLRRWTSERAARVLGAALVVAATAGVVSGVVLDVAAGTADRVFAARDRITPDGVERPTSALRSGGDGSLVSWDSLGREGRVFTGSGPTAQEITELSGRSALEPVRVFVGTARSGSIEGRARLAVAELERTGAFERSHLLVATTTGSGWLERSSVDAFEHLTDGDSAIVGIQYSHLPSWISYLVDQEEARSAGRELFDAVYARWSELPAQDRPRLLVFGESLGSFGAETAFSGEFDLATRTDGALLVGPPSFNPLFRRFTDDRAAGTPEVQPVFRDGRTVRFSDRAFERVPPEGEPWDGSRVLYLQHASDPIVWWNTDLLLQRPDWLDEPRGEGVLDEVVWLPFVTFWQLTADLSISTSVPDGYGHRYTGEHADAWAAVLRTPGWTAERSDDLRRVLTDRP